MVNQFLASHRFLDATFANQTAATLINQTAAIDDDHKATACPPVLTELKRLQSIVCVIAINLSEMMIVFLFPDLSLSLSLSKIRLLFASP